MNELQRLAAIAPPVWNDGAPPAPGWYRCRDNLFGGNGGEQWRWWDGEEWSYFATPDNSAEYAEWASKQKIRGRVAGMITIQWCDYWPEDARVQRDGSVK